MRKRKQSFIVILMVVVIGVLFFKPTENYSQNLRFVDEEEHMVIGSLLNQGYRLYDSVVTNHQPYPYLFSQAIHRVSHPNTLFLLLKRHREFVYVWHLVWMGVLISRFSWRVVPAILMIETIQYYRLGNELLAESLVAYPLAYLYLATYELVIANKRKREDVWLGATTGFCALTLLPLFIPLTLITGIRYGWKRVPGLARFALGVIISMLPVGLMVSIPGYFRWGIMSNYLYQAKELNVIKTFSDFTGLFSLPFKAFGESTSTLVLLTQITTLIWLAVFLALLVKRRWYQSGGWLGLFILWGSSNTRDLFVNRYYYQGFHLFPWQVVGLLVGTYGYFHLFAAVKSTIAKIVLLVIGLMGSGLLLTRPNLPAWVPQQPLTDNYVQYTPIFQASTILNILKQPGDTMMALPTDAIFYWTTGITPATRQVTYYHWMYFMDKEKQEFLTALSLKPPTFIQFLDEGSAYTPHINTVIAQDYVKIYQQPNIYVRKDRWKQITPTQQRQLAELSYMIQP